MRKIINDLISALHFICKVSKKNILTSTVKGEGGVKNFLKPGPNHKIKVAIKSIVLKSF